MPIFFLHISVVGSSASMRDWFLCASGLGIEWPSLVSTSATVCTDECIFLVFLVLVYSGSQPWFSRKTVNWTQNVPPEIFTLPLTSHVTWGSSVSLLESVSLLQNENNNVFFPVHLWGWNEIAGGTVTLDGCHICLLWIFQFSTAA